MLKVVLYCSAANKDHPVYSIGGIVHRELEEKTGQKLDFHSFGGLLEDDALEQFIRESRNADVVITDAWVYPASGDPELAMYEAAMAIRRLNPKAIILSQLSEGHRETSVHRIGIPIVHYRDETVVWAVSKPTQA